MKYLVTGGAGFIGSHIAESLLNLNHDVVIFDDFSSGNQENIDSLPNIDQLTIINGSITDRELLIKTCREIEGIFHQAARISVPESIRFPDLTNEVNITGTLNILMAAQECEVEKVVIASSAAVYGDDPILPKTESMMPNPKSPYAVSKITDEYYCSVFSQICDLKTICLRYFNVFGPRQDPNSEYAAVIPRFIMRILNNQPPLIYGDGNQTRDFIYVQDVVEANILAMSSNKCGVFNIANGMPVSLNQLVLSISAMMKYSNQPIYREPRQGDIRHSYADITKATEKLLFKPQYSLVNGLKETIEWFRAGRSIR